MENAEKVYIVGVHEDGLEDMTRAARQCVEAAEVLIGEGDVLALVPEVGAERLAVKADMADYVRAIEAASGRRAVVLALGDPLFYGTAQHLCEQLGKDHFEVIPHVTTMQRAFARVKESWDEAFLTNLADHSVASVVEGCRVAEKVGLFTTESCPPPLVARTLLEQGIDYFTGYVCENLGSPQERVTQGELAELAEMEFTPLNVMILVRKPSVPDRPSETMGRRLFGNPDEVFLQSRPKRGLLTPAEIRAVALAELDLGPASVVWDVGAGSGSLAVEAAQIARAGKVFAIEMDPEDHLLIEENARRFQVENLVGVLGRAPEAWADLPDPDAVFVGGSGRGVSRLVEAACRRLRTGGRLVATMGSIDNVAETYRLLHELTPDTKVWMLNFARGNYQMGRVRFEALTPTFLISMIKPRGRA